MEKVIAQLRLAAVLFSGTVFLRSPTHLLDSWGTLALWGAALVYAVSVLVVEPYRRAPVLAWDVASGFIDWGFITTGIVAMAGARSELYLLYFLSVLAIALRFTLREVVIVGTGTAFGYLAVVACSSDASAQALQEAGMRMGYLMLFAVGSGVLAREANRNFRARIKEEAQRLSVQEVTATVSHDLTNPLTAVSGLVEMLLSSADTLSLDQRGLLHRINANTQQMTNLVANLLDAELIDRGRQSFHPAPVEINALVRRVVEAQAHQAEVKQIGLLFDLSDRLPLAMLDGRMIERLVANLLSNALKFTPENGAVRVSTRQRGSRLVIEVWDDGPEVPVSLQAVLFDKYVRQPDSSGLGLGLYICKSIVDKHRGSIDLRKAAGGVAFVVELPLATSAVAQVQAVPSPTGPAARRLAWRRPRHASALASR